MSGKLSARRVSHLAVPAAFLCLAALAAGEPDLPSADQCQKWASVRLGSDEGPANFAVAVSLRGARMYNFDALTARWEPARAMGFVVDPSDGTPVMASFDTQTILYLAGKGMVLRIPKSNLKSICRFDDEHLNFAIAAPAAETEIDVSLGTIFAEAK